MSEAANGLAAEVGSQGTVLLVDDDPVARSSFSQLLQCRGVTTFDASTGEGAVLSALAHRPDVMVLDNRLGKPGDMTGIDVIDALHAQSFYPTWILYSGFMELDLAVDAGRRDVFCVVQLPSIDIETPVMKALAAAREGQVSGWPFLPVGQLPLSPHTTAVKGAGWILLACDSLDDLPSFPAWASFVNTNERRMRDLYEQLRLEPHHVKSFMRWFRALARASGDAENAIAEMIVGDPRTLKRLRDEAGLSSSEKRMSLEQFLRSQTFLPVDHVLSKTLRSLTTSRNMPDLLKR
jgi:CheY-like chemotaxis protein